MFMSRVRAIIKLPCKPSRSIDICNSLKDLQSIVGGGYIEPSHIPNTGLSFIVNQDHIVNNLKPNVVNGSETLCGTVILVKFGSNGYVTDLNDKEVEFGLKLCELSALDENGNWATNQGVLEVNKILIKTSKLDL